jgi:hypothetical protein
MRVVCSTTFCTSGSYVCWICQCKMSICSYRQNLPTSIVTSYHHLKIDGSTFMWWFTSFKCTFTMSHSTEYENILTSKNKHYNQNTRNVPPTKDMQQLEMRCPTFTGCIDLCITYFECFVFVLSINFLYVGIFYISMNLHMSRAVCTWSFCSHCQMICSFNNIVSKALYNTEEKSVVSAEMKKVHNWCT